MTTTEKSFRYDGVSMHVCIAACKVTNGQIAVIG
jgi:hypothetical protein